MSASAEITWWLDWGSAPEQLLWARLSVFADGSAEIFDLDGRYHQFKGRNDAIDWLLQDEYVRYESLLLDGEIPSGVIPPTASNDALLQTHMHVRLGARA